MSLPKESKEDLFTSDKILNNFLSEDDPMMVFSKNIYPLFSDEDFKGFYSEKGRNGLSPAFLALVTILQWKEHLSDTETAHACINRIDWKIALRIPLESNSSFDPSTLCYFRKRIKDNGSMTLIFDKIVQFAIKKKFIHKTTNQRIDATNIVKHINRISTTDLLFKSVKCVVEEIKSKSKDIFKNDIPNYLKERYLNSFSSFGLSKEKRADKQSEIVSDGYLLKEILAFNKLNINQLEIMETVFKENVTVKEIKVDDKEFIEVEEIQKPKQSIFDPRDPTLKLGKKGRKSWVGSKCHIIETAVKKNINLITGIIPDKSTVNDNLVHDKIREKNLKHNLKPEKTFVDQGYTSTKDFKSYEENGQCLMGFIQDDTTQKDDRFKISKFQIDVKNKIAICPNNKVSNNYNVTKAGEVKIFFSKTDCQSCEYFSSCVTGKTEKKRSLNVHKDYEILKNQREKQTSLAFHKEMRVRAQIEATFSELVRFHGFRKIKYKGENGRELQLCMAATGLNVKRIIRILTFGKKLA